jgi:hypothetical protein
MSVLMFSNHLQDWFLVKLTKYNMNLIEFNMVVIYLEVVVVQNV